MQPWIIDVEEKMSFIFLHSTDKSLTSVLPFRSSRLFCAFPPDLNAIVVSPAIFIMCQSHQKMPSGTLNLIVVCLCYQFIAINWLSYPFPIFSKSRASTSGPIYLL